MSWVPFRIVAVLAILAIPATLRAQCPPQAQGPTGPAPLFVRFAGPAGMAVTVFRCGPEGETISLPCMVAFRPGYRYRIELGGLPENLRPKAGALTVCPSIDVVGSIQMGPCMKPWEHPVNIVFTEDDFLTVRSGSVVTKVIVLERPETAVPVATSCDKPYEITVPPNRDPMIEAQQHGRALLVLIMGDNQVSREELACQGIPGTILLPGETSMPPCTAKPCLPSFCYPLANICAPTPKDEYCFHDGGDMGLPVGLNSQKKLVGLDPADTVAQYVDGCGRDKIAISNMVCFCVPRFLLVRTALTPAGNTNIVGPGDTRVTNAPARSEVINIAIEHQQEEHPALISTRIKASALVNLQQTQVIGQVEGVVVHASAVGVGDVTGECKNPVCEECGCLIIDKWPDKCEVHLGEVVTFYLRYRNKGTRPITNVVVSDSLTARLEYVPNSARSDRDALFTTTPNEVDSSVLRWEITGALRGGEVGIVCFQARVR